MISNCIFSLKLNMKWHRIVHRLSIAKNNFKTLKDIDGGPNLMNGWDGARVSAGSSFSVNYANVPTQNPQMEETTRPFQSPRSKRVSFLQSLRPSLCATWHSHSALPPSLSTVHCLTTFLWPTLKAIMMWPTFDGWWCLKMPLWLIRNVKQSSHLTVWNSNCLLCEMGLFLQNQPHSNPHSLRVMKISNLKRGCIIWTD